MGKKSWIFAFLFFCLVAFIGFELYTVIKIRTVKPQLHTTNNSAINGQTSPAPLPSIAVLPATNSFFLTGILESISHNDKNAVTVTFRMPTQTFTILASDGVVPISIIKSASPAILQPATKSDITFLIPLQGEEKLKNYIGKVVTLHFFERKLVNDPHNPITKELISFANLVNSHYTCNQQLLNLLPPPSPTPRPATNAPLSCTPFTDKFYVFE